MTKEERVSLDWRNSIRFAMMGRVLTRSTKLLRRCGQHSGSGGRCGEMSLGVEGRCGDSVAVVDDHDAIHAAVELWCSQSEPRIRVAGHYFSAQEFLRKHPCARESEITTVVLDIESADRRIDFEGMDRMIESRYRVIVYSDVAADEVILTCLERGVVTYLVKSEGKQPLIQAIRLAGTDTPYVGRRMAAALEKDQSFGRPKLAPREKEVMMAWFRTDSKEHVANELDIAPTTVRTHLQRVRAKYAAVGRPATSKAALIARAVQDGFLTIDELCL
jgi:DNA-binding NarL/FixJ family response regulator